MRTEVRRKRARLRAWRRGFREADLILGPFADASLGDMTEAQLTSFERLLDVNDQDLYGWVVGDAPAPVEYDDDVLAALKQSAWSGKAARLD
jgi:antitoxin CptB